MAVLASGNGSNLQALIDTPIDPAVIAVVVVNKVDARAKARAEAAGIPAVYVDHKAFEDRTAFDVELVRILRSYEVEWVALAGFMRILGAPMIEAFGGRIVNVHPALLPSFPGLHAQRQAAEAGARVAGCTIHLVDSGVDTGPVLAQAALRVGAGETAATLAPRILRLEHALYPAVIRALATGKLVDGPTGPRLEGELGLAEVERELDALISPR